MNRITHSPTKPRGAARRMVLGIVATAALVLTGCATDGADSSGTVTFATFGGVFEEAETKAWLDPFAEATGTEVLTDGPVDYGKLQSMVESGNVIWDVVEVGGDFGSERAADLLEPLDCTLIDCGGAIEGLQNTEYRVAISTTGQAIAYNSSVSEPVRGWADFFDLASFPGKRTISSSPSSGILEGALLADGVAPGDLYPLDLDRAFVRLDTIKSEIIWWDTPTLSQELLASGEAAVGMLWTPRIYDLITRQGASIGFEWDGVIVSADYLVIPKGSKNVDAANALIAWITDPANNGRLSDEYPLGPAVEGAPVNADVSEWLSSSHVDVGVVQDVDYYNDNLDEITDRFLTWVQNG